MKVYVPVIVANAVVQALLVLGDPVPSTSWVFVLLTVASFVSVVAAGGLLARTAAGGGGYVRPLIWSTAVTVVSVVAAIAHPIAAAVVLLIGAIAAPGIMRGGNIFRVLTHAPIRSVLAIVAFVLLAALTWVIALGFGFFITGAIGALLTWLWAGVAAVLVLTHWFSVYDRALSRD